MTNMKERKIKMKKIIYIMGKSSSGKDTIFNILKNDLDVTTYVMYTTRPKRNDEIEGKTYNFISQEEMQKYITGERKNDLIEERTYNTVYGPWTYATIEDNQFKTKKDILMLGTLESYAKIKEHFSKNENLEIIPIYIEVPDGIRLRRALDREDKQENPKYIELCRRFLADNKDFSEENIEKQKIQKRFENIELSKCVKEIEEYIKNQEK